VRVVWPSFNRQELIDLLRSGVAELAPELPLRRVVLFGSWAKGRATAYSDVDLLVIYAGPNRKDAFSTVLRHVRVRGLEPHVYTEEEAASISDTLESMTRDAVTIYPS
jgi:predicted nucleotidyltransferase